MIWNEAVNIDISNPILRSVITAIARSIIGWLENSISGGKWNFDFRKLLETIFRVLPQALGLSAVGAPPEAAFLTDWAGVRVSNSIEKKNGTNS